MKRWVWSFIAIFGFLKPLVGLADVGISAWPRILFLYEDKNVDCRITKDHLVLTVGVEGVDGGVVADEEADEDFVTVPKMKPRLKVEIEGLGEVLRALETKDRHAIYLKRPTDTQYVNYWADNIIFTIQPRRASGVPGCEVVFQKSKSDPNKMLYVSLSCEKLLPKDKKVRPQSGQSFFIPENKPVSCPIR